MAKGIITKESVEEVKSRTRIELIVEEQVSLRSAGAGTLKGLCPFHDEKTPSFTVRPALGTYHCFGCGQGGDVIKFVRELHGLDFKEAVEYLADRSGVELKYEAARAQRASAEDSAVSRGDILRACQLAQEFYACELLTPAATEARNFLLERAFNGEHATRFGLGFSPAKHDALLSHLRKAGFTEAQLEATGLFGRNAKGLYDRFRGRLMFPIHDLTGAVVGFGGRQILPDGTNAKYINPPETRVYNKSRILYGAYFARKAIKDSRRVVVVEGYTDVMAMHLSGEQTAVASCGTAFAHGHVDLARRLMGDSVNPAGNVLLGGNGNRPLHTLGGQVIFTFDGDAAGQAAALKAFNEDQSFAAQTFVAVEPNGQDPCDLWKNAGPGGVRALLDMKIPLFEFVLKSYISQYDLRLPEGRVGALHACAPVAAQIKDAALKQEYSRVLAGWLGLPPEQVSRAIRQARPVRLRPPVASTFPGPGNLTGAPARTATAPYPPTMEAGVNASGPGTNPGGSADFNVNAQVGATGFAPGGTAAGAPPAASLSSPETNYPSPVASGSEWAAGRNPVSLAPERLKWLVQSPGQVALERQALASLLQFPDAASGSAAAWASEEIFSVPEYARIFAAWRELGGIEQFLREWATCTYPAPSGRGLDQEEALRVVSMHFSDLLAERLGETLGSLLTSLQALPLPLSREQDAPAYIEGVWHALYRTFIESQISEAKRELSVVAKGTPRYNELFLQIFELQSRLREHKPSGHEPRKLR